MNQQLWIIVCLAAVGLAAAQEDGEASIEVNTETSPSYYKDVPVTIKCDYSFSDADYARFGVLLDDSVWMGCAGIQTSVDVSGARLKEEAGAPEYSSPSEEDCKTAYDMLTSTGNTSLSFTVSSIYKGSYTCSVRKLRRSADSDPVEVTQVKELPTSIIPSVKDGDKVLAGDRVDFICFSEGGNPESVYEYSRDDGMVTGDGVQFVATSGDDKTKLHCRDTAHDDYANPPTPTTSYTSVINVYYLEAPMTQKNMTLNPDFVNDLKCAVSENLPEGKEVIYSWQRFGKVMDEETDAVLKVSVAENVTEEDVSCTASVDNIDIKPVTIDFGIMWDVDAPEPPAPTNPTTKLKPAGSETDDVDDDKTTMVVIIVIVVLVVVIVVVLIVILVRRRRNSGSAETPAASDTRTPEKDKNDLEKGKMDGEAAPMMQQTESEGRGEHSAESPGGGEQ